MIKVVTVEAGYSRVGYNEVLDIAKRVFGPGKNYFFVSQNIVGYSEVGYNVIPLIAKQFFGPI